MLLQYKPVYGESEAKALYDLVMSGSYLADFEWTEGFENKIKEHTGNQYCSVVNNGTIALSIALYASGVRAKDRVIVPNLTMIATANAVKFIGAEPVFCDINKETGCMNVTHAMRWADLKDNVKAIIYVTLNGRSDASDLLALKKYCDNHNLILIKDDAQSLGSYSEEGISLQNSKYAHIHTLSFSPHKIVSCGQGGAILTDDKTLAENIKRLKDFGRLKGGADIHDHFGINSKFTEMQAVVGISQINQLQDRILFKRRIYDLYYNSLLELINSNTIQMYKRTVFETPWFVDVYFKGQESWEMSNPRDKIVSYLKDKGIGTRPVYPPLHSQKCYDIKWDYPNTEYVSKRGLWLPSSFDLKDEEIEFVCNTIKELFK